MGGKSTMKRGLAAIGAIAIACVVDDAAARTIRRYDVSGWDVSATANDKTGKFSSCIASARYNSGVQLLFLIDEHFNWFVALGGQRINVINGRNYDFIFRIDDGLIQKYNSKAIGNDMILVSLNDDVSLFNEMRRGRTLFTKVGNDFVSFNLDGSSRMLTELALCVKNKGRAVVPPPLGPGTASSSDSPSRASGAPSSGSKRGSINTGSGFFVNGQGDGITNAHVVAGCTSATISGYGLARIVARDVSNDLALLKLATPTVTPFANMRRKPLQLGESVYVMGFPLAGQLDNGLNFTSGLVSSLAGMGNDARLLQFTAPIQLGNSGGPIVDNSGLIIGVIQSKMSEIASLRDSGSLPQNLNFGIKADLAANFLRANGSFSTEIDNQSPRDATMIASEGRKYTFQIKCTVEQ